MPDITLDQIVVGTEVSLLIDGVPTSGVVTCLVNPWRPGTRSQPACLRISSGNSEDTRSFLRFVDRSHLDYRVGRAHNGVDVSCFYSSSFEVTGFRFPEGGGKLSDGAYGCFPGGALLISGDNAWYGKGGQVVAIPDFLNEIGNGSVYIPNIDPLIEEETYARNDEFVAVRDTGWVVRVAPVGAVFGVRRAEGGPVTLHRRCSRGIEPLEGFDRVSVSSMRECAAKVYPLTCRAAPVKVGDEFHGPGRSVKLLAIGREGGRSLFLASSVLCDPGELQLRFASFRKGEFGSDTVSGFGDLSRDPPRNVPAPSFPEVTSVNRDWFVHGAEVTIDGETHRLVGADSYGDRISARFQPDHNAGSKTVEFFESPGGWLCSGRVVPINSTPSRVSYVRGALYRDPEHHPVNRSVFERAFLAVDHDFLVLLWSGDNLLRNQPFGTDPTALDPDEDRPLFSGEDDLPAFLLAAPGDWAITESSGDGLQITVSPGVGVIGVTAGRWEALLVGPTFRTTVPLPVENSALGLGSGHPRRTLAFLDTECTGCQGRFHGADTVLSATSLGFTRHLCQTCLSALTAVCPTCGRPFVGSGSLYCGGCAENDKHQVIHPYSYKPSPVFNGKGPLFFGTEVELEINPFGSDRKSAAKAVVDASKGLLYGKSDGSIINGVEFVSHPFSLDFLLQNKESVLKPVFDYLKTNMHADINCGIHVHTSKAGYEVLPSSIPTTPAGHDITKHRLITRGLLRAQKFVYGNPDLIHYFAGRRSHYASLDVVTGTEDTSKATSYGEMIRLSKHHTAVKYLRYAAMNFTEDTVEFRVFRATTDLDEYVRNVLFVDSIVQYARTHAMPKRGAPSLLSYRRFLDTSANYFPVASHFDAWDGKPTPALVTSK